MRDATQQECEHVLSPKVCQVRHDGGKTSEADQSLRGTRALLSPPRRASSPAFEKVAMLV